MKTNKKDTSALPESAYKDGHLTFSGLMMSPVGCQKSFANWFADRTPQFCTWGKTILDRWQAAGFPSLGEFPPQTAGVRLLDYALGAMVAVTPIAQYPRGVESSQISLDEVSLPLSTILRMCSSPEHGDFEIRNLAQNDQSYHHLKALTTLWQELGCPDSLLWLETRVFCNRLANAPKAA